MLAMVVNDYARLLVKRGALESIASRLAPTVTFAECRPYSSITHQWPVVFP